MKYINSNGRNLEVRDISEPVMELELLKPLMPLPIIVGEIFTDEKARDIMKDILATRLYKRKDVTAANED